MVSQFTYANLGTLTGAIAATVLVVEFIKEMKYFKLLPTRWLAFMVAETIVISTSVANGEFAFINLPLYFLNGILVTASAMGGRQIISDSLGNVRGKALKGKGLKEGPGE